MTTEHEPSLSIFMLLQSQLPTPQSMNVRPTEVFTNNEAVVHAVDGDGYPTLLIPVPSDTDTHVDWQNRSITFGYRTIIVDGVGSLFLSLQCKLERLLPQFALLVDDILDAIEADPSNANMVTRNTLDRWREMLKDSKQLLLSESQLSGLYGELTFLGQLVSVHGAAALDAWTGPQGNRHDFECTNASFEVKTTTNHNNMIVSFHGVRQLEMANDTPLFVVAHQIERIPGGKTVPDLLVNLCNSGVDRFELLRKLAEVGYHEIDALHYKSAAFSVLETKTFLVDADFPRIARDTVTDKAFLEKISALQYSVDLGYLESTSIELETFFLAVDQ